jgi:hypothetical protein
MRGDEKRVVDAFVAWLQQNGWTADTELNFVDVCARRGDERMYAEAKGRTAAIGLDVDTLYGQLLRRMADPSAGARYAVVVPTVAVQAALRVPAWVHQRLSIDVYEVDDAGKVHPRKLAPPVSPHVTCAPHNAGTADMAENPVAVAPGFRSCCSSLGHESEG